MNKLWFAFSITTLNLTHIYQPEEFPFQAVKIKNILCNLFVVKFMEMLNIFILMGMNEDVVDFQTASH
jgi:hypothetical protein